MSQVENYTPSQELYVTTRVRLLRSTAVVIFLTHNISQRCTHLAKRLTFRSGGAEIRNGGDPPRSHLPGWRGSVGAIKDSCKQLFLLQDSGAQSKGCVLGFQIREAWRRELGSRELQGRRMKAGE